MSKRYDLVGVRFGRLTVVAKGMIIKTKQFWDCACDCGRYTAVNTRHLNAGLIVSCGCQGAENRKKAITTHGMSKTKIYRIWFSMLQRCENPNDKNYYNYGGRGISVCDRWHCFDKFFSDMGFRPDGMSMDRKNNNGNYDPSNCAWATTRQQHGNRRIAIKLQYDGESHTLIEWSEFFQIKYDALYYNVQTKGLSLSDALLVLLPAKN